MSVGEGVTKVVVVVMGGAFSCRRPRSREGCRICRDGVETGDLAEVGKWAVREKVTVA